MMNKRGALKEAIRLFGKTACVEDTGRPTNEAERQAAFLARQEMRIALSHEQLRSKQHRDTYDAFLSAAMRYRYSIGKITTIGPFRAFHIEASGDTWEEAFAKYRDNQHKERERAKAIKRAA